MRIALGIAYEGTRYHGWQAQHAELPTIQACLEAAVSKVANQTVQIFCAGRTDKGVHALGQVAHFDTTAVRSERAWLLGVNTYLPPDIRVHWVKEAAEDFHARYTALARSYRYLLYNHATHPALLANKSAWHIKPLDVALMQTAGDYLLGEHDFSAFRAAECQARSPIKTLYYLKVRRKNHFVFLDIKASGFLHHMVRNILGVLLPIGEGKCPPVWMREVLRSRDRKQAGVTAPAAGLYFEKAYYPYHYSLPDMIEEMGFE